MATTDTTNSIVTSVTWADLVILGVILLSIIIGLWRGFVREALSLVTWGAAILFALLYCTEVSQYLYDDIQAPAMRILAGFATIFFSVIIVGTILSKIFSGIIKKTGLSGADRVIGIAFGALRGVLVVALLIAVANLIHLNREPAWEQSVLVPKFAAMVDWLHNSIPPLLNGTQTV